MFTLALFKNSLDMCSGVPNRQYLKRLFFEWKISEILVRICCHQ